MLKWALRQVHQSWVVVCWCVGVVIGVVVGMVFRVNYFGSVVWIVGCVVLLVLGYLKPRVAVVGLAVMAVTLMINPGFVINMGWLLSFASYAGIMVLSPKISRWLFGERKPGFVASMIITTVSATVMILPIILYYYGAVSLISVVANLLILPTLPWVMGAVFMAGVLLEYF